MLERIRERGLVRDRERHPRRVLRRRLLPRRPRVLRPGVRRGGRGGRRGDRRRRHPRHRDAGGGGAPRLAGARPARRPGALARPRRLRARDGGRDRGRAGRRDVGAGDGQRHGGAGRERRPRRGRARARGALRDPDATRPDAGAALSRLVAERAATPLPPWKAVTGEALFTRESGAVAAQFHDPPAIEPYASELVGAERGIVLGKKSGIDSIRIARRGSARRAGGRTPELLASVKALGTSRSQADDVVRRTTDTYESITPVCLIGVDSPPSTSNRATHRPAVVLRGDGVVPVGRRDRDHGRRRRHPARPDDDRGLQRLGRAADDPRLRRPRLADARGAPRDGRFVVNFIGEGRSELCLLFASKEEDKFAASRGGRRASGLPLLHEDALAWAECATSTSSRSATTSSSSHGSTTAASARARAAAHVLPALVGRLVARHEPDEAVPCRRRSRSAAATSAGKAPSTRLWRLASRGRVAARRRAFTVAEPVAGSAAAAPPLTVMSARWDTRRVLTCHDAGGRSMRFSLYTEMQLHEGKSPEQLYGEVLEQIENADRLGYDCYASIEHFFFPKFSISAHPTALFAAAAQRTRTSTSGRCCTRCRTTTRWCWRSVIAVTDILTGGRYEWGVGRGHGWIPGEGGRAARRARAAALRGGGRPPLHRARQRALLAQGRVLRGRPTRTSSRSRTRSSGSSSAARPTGRTSSRPSTAGASRCRRSSRTRRSRSSSTSIARSAPSTGRARHRLDPRLPPRRGPRHGDARGARLGHRSSSTATARRSSSTRSRPPTRSARPATASTPRGSWSSSPRSRSSSSSRRTTSGSARPDEIVERIEETRKLCPGITEIGITVNAGGAPHWMAIKNQELFASAGDPARSGPPRRRRRVGARRDRACLRDRAGVIGSLFAGHLAQVADVSVLTRRREHADALNRDGLRVTGAQRPPGARHRRRRPGRARAVRPRHRRDEGDRPRGGGALARGPVPGRDADDDAQRPRRGGGRARARRLAARLGRDVHVRDEALGHRGRVHPRHGDVDGAVRGHAARAGRGDRRADPARGPQGRGLRRPATRAVVEADLQRDRQLGRRAHRPPPRPRTSRRRRRPPTSGTSSTTSSTRARRSRPRRASSSTRTRGR